MNFVICSEHACRCLRATTLLLSSSRLCSSPSPPFVSNSMILRRQKNFCATTTVSNICQVANMTDTGRRKTTKTRLVLILPPRILISRSHGQQASYQICMLNYQLLNCRPCRSGIYPFHEWTCTDPTSSRQVV